MRDITTKLLAPFRGGGIRRRLLIWGLSLFGIALLFIVVAGYSYMERQIRQDAAALQSELAAVTGQRVHNFVQRKIERFSDNANALSLYQLGDKEQRLLLGLLVKNDSSFTHAAIIDSQGMEVLKVSDRKVYFPSDLTDQSKSPNSRRPSTVRIISAQFILRLKVSHMSRWRSRSGAPRRVSQP